MSDDEGAQIIQLPTATDPAREAVEDERALDDLGVRHQLDKHGYAKVGRCWHNQHPAKIDLEARRLHCGGCGSERDPYEVMEDIARRNAVYVSTRRKLKRQIRYLEARLESLKRDERNAKSRIRNAKKRAGLETRADGWPLCPVCGEDELGDLRNVVPDLGGELYCHRCSKVTVKGRRPA